jgi:acyl-CoA thioesterase-1
MITKFHVKNQSPAFRVLLVTLMLMASVSTGVYAQAPTDTYLQHVNEELKKTWPGNRTINLVFHGHSVPAGYFKTPDVKTLEAYPHQVLTELKNIYPNAVINIIVTAIGGENSEQGEKRFDEEVLVHRPDVLFIDYALNDRRIGLAKAKALTENMIRKAQQKKIPVILLTPSPDMRVDITKDNNELAQFSSQIRQLAKDHGVGLADSYQAFESRARNGEDLNAYMSQVNHPNTAGHALIAEEVLRYFR